MSKLLRIFNRPTDYAFLVYFRVFAGGFLSGELINILFNGDFKNYTEPAFQFTFQFFPWVPSLPATELYILFGITILAGFFVAFGWYYRISAVVLFFGHVWIFLMEATEYVNHAYLYCLIAFLMIWLPAHRQFSLDVKWRGVHPVQSVPSWIFILLIFQISVVYFYAGIAKLHADWFDAKAMRIWMAAKGDAPIIGPLLQQEWAPVFQSYGGLLFDLLVVPGLLWKRTRWIAFSLALFFHMSNVLTFGLATFPWFSLMMTTLFFGPSWPRKLPVFRRMGAYDQEYKPLPAILNKNLALAVIAVAVIQLVLPFRHFLYPGSPNWNEEGHQFSWHMMLRSKHAQTSFLVKADEDEFQHNGRAFLFPHQLHRMGGNPELILNFAHFLRDYYEEKGYKEISVYADAMVSLNGRPLRRLVHPEVDLAKEKRKLGHYSWILPLRE